MGLWHTWVYRLNRIRWTVLAKSYEAIKSLKIFSEIFCNIAEGKGVRDEFYFELLVNVLRKQKLEQLNNDFSTTKAEGLFVN